MGLATIFHFYEDEFKTNLEIGINMNEVLGTLERITREGFFI